MRSTRFALPRRTVLRGAGAVIALPFLEAMLPAGRSTMSGRARRARLIAIEMVHGAAGSTEYGRSRNLWSPATVGRDFDFTPTLQSLAPFRDYLTIISNTKLAGAESRSSAEEGDGVDHARSSAAFLTGAHPLRTARGDVVCGPSIDQLIARHIGGAIPIQSMHMSVEELREPAEPSWPQGYSPAYRHAISWRDARNPVLPETRMSTAFARLFGIAPARANSGSVLDGIIVDARRLHASLASSDRQRIEAHLDDIRALERNILRFETAQGASEASPSSYIEHFRILSDLVTLALAADLTRVSTLKLGLDRSQRVYTESGVTTPFHTASHHRQEPDRIEMFARLNAFHVQQLAYLLDRLNSVGDAGDTLLARSLVFYGSPMGDSHVHGHANLPILLAGGMDGAITGNQHLACAPGTPMANVLLSVAHKFGLSLDQIGDSTGLVDI
ncbi:MAG: DUF1552 domain-containing protein [Pseudomonadota bacterium]